MRDGTLLIARGMFLPGCCASAAARPMISMPPKANITTAKAETKPSRPFGNQPPCDQRFEMPVAAWRTALPSDAVELKPKKMIQAPPAIIAQIATTLISDSQNSISPNILTAHRFRPAMISVMPSDHSHGGTSGNQSPM